MRCAHPDDGKSLPSLPDFRILDVLNAVDISHVTDRMEEREKFVPQWPSDNNSVNHVRREGQCGTNS